MRRDARDGPRSLLIGKGLGLWGGGVVGFLFEDMAEEEKGLGQIRDGDEEVS